ncbi:MAG: hypothetical protein ACRCYC_09035 [Paraclostridium sp.]|uniref:hypothetical protein n=1 Tax=Paraclostridium sp. TaxID=2023273 RepID=UPI003F2ED2AA
MEALITTVAKVSTFVGGGLMFLSFPAKDEGLENKYEDLSKTEKNFRKIGAILLLIAIIIYAIELLTDMQW